MKHPTFPKPYIDAVLNKLAAENVDINDHDACYNVLDQTVSPKLCARIYHSIIAKED